MKISKIREMSSPELEKELGELKTELFKLKFSLAPNGLDNPMKIKEVKRDIAKINTVLTERNLFEAYKIPRSGESVCWGPADQSNQSKNLAICSDTSGKVLPLRKGAIH